MQCTVYRPTAYRFCRATGAPQCPQHEQASRGYCDMLPVLNTFDALYLWLTAYTVGSNHLYCTLTHTRSLRYAQVTYSVCIYTLIHAPPHTHHIVPGLTHMKYVGVNKYTYIFIYSYIYRERDLVVKCMTLKLSYTFERDTERNTRRIQKGP